MKKLMLIIAALSLVATAASADILWDQSVPDAAQGGVNDSQSGCAPLGSSIFQANDVTFAENVEIQSITTWYTADDPNFEAVTTEAYLMIVPKTGPAPSWPDEDPTTYDTVPVTITEQGGYKLLNASGLAVQLAAGDYWVCFTPISFTPAGFTDQHMLTASQVGDGLAALIICDPFTPANWYASPDLFGMNIDSTLLIEGLMGVVPNEDKAWGDMKALFR